MKKIRLLLIAVIVFSLIFGIGNVYAEDGSTAEDGDATADESGLSFDWEQYTYEELLKIKSDIDNAIQAKQREYALENGNRKITLADFDAKVYVGKTIRLEATVEKLTEDAPAKTSLVWSSSDESVAKVSSAGEITAIAAGRATIICRASDDEFVFAESVVDVIEPVKSIAIDNPNQTILISDSGVNGNTLQLSCTVLPENAFCKDLNWSSSDEKIATVDGTGLVKAKAPGKVTITVVSEDPFSKDTRPIKASFQLTVNQAVSAIELSSSEATLDKKEKTTLTAVILPTSATNKKLVWDSSNPSVATVTASGQVAAVGCGETVIRCVAVDGSGASAECKVNVIQKITGLKFTSPLSTLALDQTAKLQVAITPEDATNKNLVWTSSDEKVATVDSSGNVKAISGGKATITCSAVDGSNKTVSQSIFVPSFKVSTTEYTVISKSGMTISLEYLGAPGNLVVTNSGKTFFDCDYTLSGTKINIDITPRKAGKGNLILKDNSDPKNMITLQVTIDHDAVYDTTSYPKGDYTSIMRYPSSYNGDKISIYGRVLQVQKSWGSYTLRVATKGRWDNVFYVTGSSDVSIIEGDYITVYGTCTGTKTYTTILGGSITIPSMRIEQLYIGRN